MLIRVLREYTKPYRLQVGVVMVLLLIQNMLSLYLPTINADIVNNGVTKGDLPLIYRLGGWMVAISLAQITLSIITVYLAARVGMGFARDLRAAVFARVLSFTAREIDQFGTPSLITRNTNDVQQVQMVLSVGLQVLISAPITMVGGIIMALRHSTTLTWLIAVMVPLMAGVIVVMMRIAIPQFRIVQERIDRINGVLREQITGIRVIRAFVRDSQEHERFADANAQLRDTQLKINRVFAFAMPSLMLILNLSTVGAVWFGGQLVANDQMQIGDIGAFISYLMQILMSVMMATMTLIMVPRGAASAERIQAVLDTQTSVSSPAVPVAQTAPGHIDFEDVRFSYPGAEEPVLHRLNFSIQPGSFTAVVGGTGSGKTTLVNLVLRFFDVTGGSVRVGGVDVREQDLEALWASVAVVPQKAMLFNGTVRDNVRFGARDISDEEVWRALEVAQAANFVRELEGGLDYQITQAGTNLSGGQKQRLAIARAIAMRPSIYVLDDAFSALDAATDARLRHALREETSHATLLVVAQRVSTVLHADQIIVLEGGEVAGIGTHDELMRDCEAYRELVGSQLEVGV